MNNRQRIEVRIARDKYRRAMKKKIKNKEYDNFHNVIKMQNYVSALKKCQKGVRWKGSVQEYTQNAVTEMFQSVKSLKDGKKPSLSSVRRIAIYERGKKRIIVPITIKDRMTQRVLCDNALVPVLKQSLIYDNGASLQDRGVEFTRKRLELHLAEAIKEYGNNFYALTFDFKSFFDSIPHKTCLKVLKEHFTDKYIIGLTMSIIRSYQEAEIMQIRDDTERNDLLWKLNHHQLNGICLGSQISQIMALAVPGKLDHFIKDKMGVRHYIRYMDDGVILSDNKEFLQKLYIGMQVIAKELGLNFNMKKTKIVKISRGFTFMKVQYRVDRNGKILKKLTRTGITRMRRKLKKFKAFVDRDEMALDDVYNSMQSWLSHAKVARSYHTVKNMLKLYKELFDGYKIA